MRRRTRGTWFPNTGTFIEADDSVGGREILVTPGAGGTISTVITDLTFDRPLEGEDIQGQDTLSQIIGSEYVLQRIVGKVFAHRRIVPTFASAIGLDLAVDNGPAILLGCGFFVARANDSSSGGGADTPIGSATTTERNDNYSPLEVDTVREPWIWRRTWILGSLGAQWSDPTIAGGNRSTFLLSNSSLPPGAYPPSTAGYGSVADGPHIDSRVKRRVNQDNRLWFAVSACNFPTGTSSANQAHDVTVYLDYRIFGSLRKAKGTSAF